MPTRLSVFATILVLAAPAAVSAGDWPTWRFDANRSAASPHPLPAKLYLQWVREYLPLQPAWPDQDKMQFDIVREPVAVGQTLYINSSRYDAVRALDTRTGKDKWLFFADGPVRFAPLAHDGKVYFASDDGYLYCLNGDTGKLVWKFRGGPGDRKILGNERLISTWPARGAPVIDDGKIYFAASIWPFMGIFIHCLDATTGQALWTNDGDGSAYMKQPHNADAFASVAPQGPLVIQGDKLLIPGGRSVPACFDKKTGKLLRYALAENGKRGGGSEVAASGKVFFNGGAVFDIDSEKYLSDYGKSVVLTRNFAFAWNKDYVRIFDLKNARTEEADVADEKDKDKSKEADKEKDKRAGSVSDGDPKTGDGDKEKDKDKKKKKVTRWIMPEVAATKMLDVETMIAAGTRLYFGGPGHVTVLDWDEKLHALAPSWKLDVPGKVVRMIAADDRLFVVTREGFVYCFGSEEVKPVRYAKNGKDDFGKVTPNMQAKAEQILSAAKTRSGYAIVWGAGDGRLVEALARQSQLHLIVIEPNADKVRALRERWTEANLYGARIALLAGDAQSIQLPPYVASLVVCENPDIADAHFLAKAYQTLRPFGGTLCFTTTERTQKVLTAVGDLKLANAKTASTNGLTLIVRDGPLPGSANWTHEHADAANTRVSRDTLVKAPLGVLWFGGPTNETILPRHGHGPQPQVIDGRMIIEGVDLLRAIDIYTGRLLWEAKLPGVGYFYNNLYHQPGANAAGSNFVSLPDGIYVAYNNGCVRLDPATGKKIGEFTLPALGPKKESPRWGYINVVGDYLIGGADPLLDPKTLPPPPKAGAGDDPDPKEKKDSAVNKLFKAVKKFSDNMSASKHLVVMDRHTGKVLWSAAARSGFRHNATCVGGGRLYTIDRLSGDQLAKFLKDEIEPPDARLLAFDLKTGKELWNTDADVFGTWLSYSEKHDVLVEAGRVARDTLFDEPKGMRAYRADTGKPIWFDKDYTGPAMIHHDMVLQGQGACDLLTGALKMRKDPITFESVPWKWARNYGCNTPAASEHLLTFRSGAAGYFDLCNDGGTGNFGGFRSSCTNNLIVAGGLITAPEYTRTCTCAYQNQTSIALIHMPDADMWTFFGTKEVKGYVKRLGLLLGGPGDRKTDDGTLWLEYPSTGGVSPAVQIATKPSPPEIFRRHSSAVTGPYNWVTSNGMKGISEISITLGSMDRPQPYTVKLYFAEPDKMAAGQRVFHVDLGKTRVLSDFDIAKEAGGAGKSLIKEFKGVMANTNLVVRLTPAKDAEVRQTVLCGVELILEEKK